MNVDKKNQKKNNIIGDLTELPKSETLKTLNMNAFLKAFDGNSFYPSGRTDVDNVFPKKERGILFTKDMDDRSVN